MPSSRKESAAFTSSTAFSFSLTLILAMVAAYVIAAPHLVSAKMIEGLVSTLRI